MYSRFVNIRGVPGGNIPADLHNEHLNRVCKEAVKALGSNKTVEGITRAGKALGVIVPILNNRQFDVDNNVGVFESCKDRGLAGVRKPKSLINKLPLEDIQSWIAEHTERCFSL